MQRKMPLHLLASSAAGLDAVHFAALRRILTSCWAPSSAKRNNMAQVLQQLTALAAALAPKRSASSAAAFGASEQKMYADPGELSDDDDDDDDDSDDDDDGDSDDGGGLTFSTPDDAAVAAASTGGNESKQRRNSYDLSSIVVNASALSSKHQQQSNPKLWSTAQVVQWLITSVDAQFAKLYKDAFLQIGTHAVLSWSVSISVHHHPQHCRPTHNTTQPNTTQQLTGIDGDMLLTLDSDDLISEMKVSRLHARKISQHIAKLKRSTDADVSSSALARKHALAYGFPIIRFKNLTLRNRIASGSFGEVFLVDYFNSTIIAKVERGASCFFFVLFFMSLLHCYVSFAAAAAAAAAAFVTIIPQQPSPVLT
jgi:hypothetical protein